MRLYRSISRDFFSDADVVSVSPLARLLYLGLNLEADREGRFIWQPRSYGVRYLPRDTCDEISLSQELVTGGLIQLYEANGRTVAVIPGFSERQNINGRETASKLPPPPLHESTRHHASGHDDSCHHAPNRKDVSHGKVGCVVSRRDGVTPPSQTEAVTTGRGTPAGIDGEEF